ncbi:MAG TPA: hypothetical protein VIL37_21305 [Natronosporangium sp.]
MTGRILRIELRRSPAKWLALLLVLPVLLAATEAGRGLSGLALSQRQLLQFLVAPMALGIAAWQARRDRRSGMVELLGTTVRPRWQRVAPAAAALAVAGIAGMLAGLVGMAGLVFAAGGFLSPAALPVVAVSTLIAVGHAGLGLALGRWLPFPLIPPLLIGYFAVSVIVADTEGYADPPGWLLLWGGLEATMPTELAGVATGTHLGQAVWLLGLTTTAVIAFTATGRRAGAVAIAPVVLAAAIAVPVLPDRYADTFHVDPAATEPVCTPDPPRVCVLRAHQPALPALRDPARAALSILAANLPDPPTAVVEIPFLVDSPVPPRPDTITIPLIVSGTGRRVQPVSGLTSDLRWELLLGAGTPGCPNAPAIGTADRRRYDTARLVTAAWLLGQEPPEPADPADPYLLRRRETVPVYRALLALPPAEQRARVAALRAAELACDGRDRLGLLVGP